MVMGLERNLLKTDAIYHRTREGSLSLNPSPQELLQEYHKAASVWATPVHARNSGQDIGRVLTVKPSTPSRKWSRATSSAIPSQHRGHFAYGHYSGEDVRFDLYVPKHGLQVGFPLQTVQNSLGKLLVVLVESGYSPTRLRYYKK